MLAVRRPLGLLAAVLSAVLAAWPVQGAGREIKVFMTIAVQGAVDALLPAYEKASGDRVVPTYATAAILNQRITAGDRADVLISTRAGIDALVKAGTVAADTATDVARVGVGVAVRKGAPKPDISTPDALKRTLLATRGVSFSDPSAGGVSGVHFQQVLERLGIAAEMKAKSKFPAPSGFAADLLVKGEVDLAVQQVSELMSVSGTDVVGPLPGDLQLVTTFTAGVPAGTGEREAAQAFVRFLRSPQAIATLKAKGLDAP